MLQCSTNHLVSKECHDYYYVVPGLIAAVKSKALGSIVCLKCRRGLEVWTKDAMRPPGSAVTFHLHGENMEMSVPEWKSTQLSDFVSTGYQGLKFQQHRQSILIDMINDILCKVLKETEYKFIGIELELN